MFFMNLTKYQYRSLVVFVNDLLVTIVKWDEQNKEKSSSQRKVISIKFEKCPSIDSPQINCKHLVRILQHKVWEMVALEGNSSWFTSIFIEQEEDRDRELLTLKNV